jgi:hypothetical protein
MPKESTMTDLKDQMIEAVDRGWTTEADAYTFVTDSYSVAADMLYTRMKEQGYRNPLVAAMFCVTCHYTGPHDVSERCSTGFVPGDPEAVREANRKLGFPS